ncbi:MAG TPA: porin, partial [Propylenella sp.]
MKYATILFASTATLMAGAEARAADLRTIEAVDYVRICDAFGTGFNYVPGTGTCLRVSGQVRVESHWVDGDTDVLFGVHEGHVNKWTTRARGNVRLDARTPAEFGLVRAYADFELTVGPADTSLSPGPFAPDRGPGPADTVPSLASAFMQISNDWGVHTAGHTGSFFDFWGTHGYITRIGIDDSTTEQTLFGWTFAGGSGLSFTVAAEDPDSGKRRLDGDDDYE